MTDNITADEMLEFLRPDEMSTRGEASELMADILLHICPLPDDYPTNGAVNDALKACLMHHFKTPTEIVNLTKIVKEMFDDEDDDDDIEEDE